MRIAKPDDLIEIKQLKQFVENEKALNEFKKMYEVKNGYIKLNDFLNLLYKCCTFEVLNALRESE